ncbi:MAG TPA: OmpA family protein [Polyangiaceae bacterium]|nr:OmpA family protein [Polyangiaceae bacterium]
MRIALSILPAFALALVACGSDPTPPPAAPEPAPAQSTDSEKPGDDPAQSDINIDDEIKKACGLTDTEAHFAYNSSAVRAADQAVIKKLADCFVSGPLKGKSMALVGHADPRGEPEYNMVLGGKRADNVAKALTKAGLPAAQVSTTSRGELDATGTDESSWSKDRSVDVHLAK